MRRPTRLTIQGHGQDYVGFAMKKMEQYEQTNKNPFGIGRKDIVFDNGVAVHLRTDGRTNRVTVVAPQHIRAVSAKDSSFGKEKMFITEMLPSQTLHFVMDAFVLVGTVYTPIGYMVFPGLDPAAKPYLLTPYNAEVTIQYQYGTAGKENGVLGEIQDKTVQEIPQAFGPGTKEVRTVELFEFDMAATATPDTTDTEQISSLNESPPRPFLPSSNSYTNWPALKYNAEPICVQILQETDPGFPLWVCLYEYWHDHIWSLTSTGHNNWINPDTGTVLYQNTESQSDSYEALVTARNPVTQEPTDNSLHTLYESHNTRRTHYAGQMLTDGQYGVVYSESSYWSREEGYAADRNGIGNDGYGYYCKQVTTEETLSGTISASCDGVTYTVMEWGLEPRYWHYTTCAAKYFNPWNKGVLSVLLYAVAYGPDVYCGAVLNNNRTGQSRHFPVTFTGVLSSELGGHAGYFPVDGQFSKDGQQVYVSPTQYYMRLFYDNIVVERTRQAGEKSSSEQTDSSGSESKDSIYPPAPVVPTSPTGR